MQYIQKQNKPPKQWEEWFTLGKKRIYDYKDAYDTIGLKEVKKYLINEQNSLCAYCQKQLTMGNSSIEHVIPKSFNTELSTNYYNLVAVCKDSAKGSDGRYHCDTEKADLLIPSLIFVSNLDTSKNSNSKYFRVGSGGELSAKDQAKKDTKNQVNTAIDILNLNHENLKSARKEILNSRVLIHLKSHSNTDKRTTLNKIFTKILEDKVQPFRQFLLMYLAEKLGIN